MINGCFVWVNIEINFKNNRLKWFFVVFGDNFVVGCCLLINNFNLGIILIIICVFFFKIFCNLVMIFCNFVCGLFKICLINCWKVFNYVENGIFFWNWLNFFFIK